MDIAILEQKWYIELWKLKCLFIVPVRKNIQTRHTKVYKIQNVQSYSQFCQNKLHFCCFSRFGWVFWVKIFSTKHAGTRSILRKLLNTWRDISQSNVCYGVWRGFQMLLCHLYSRTESSPTAELQSAQQGGASRVGRIASSTLCGHYWQKLLQVTIPASEKQWTKHKHHHPAPSVILVFAKTLHLFKQAFDTIPSLLTLTETSIWPFRLVKAKSCQSYACDVVTIHQPFVQHYTKHTLNLSKSRTNDKTEHIREAILHFVLNWATGWRLKIVLWDTYS